MKSSPFQLSTGISVQYHLKSVTWISLNNSCLNLCPSWVVQSSSIFNKNCPGSRDICTHPLIVTVWPTCPILSNLERFIPWNFPTESSHHGEPAGAYFCLFIRKPPPKKMAGLESIQIGGRKKTYPIYFKFVSKCQSHISISLLDTLAWASPGWPKGNQPFGKFPPPLAGDIILMKTWWNFWLHQITRNGSHVGWFSREREFSHIYPTKRVFCEKSSTQKCRQGKGICVSSQ